jgi:hypothetical protein
MDFAAVQEKMAVAVSCFKSNDSELLNFDELDLPERPMSHRLGFYLQTLFNGYDVDCEYNKHRGGRKVEGIPDIVVHKRHSDERNLLAVELKARRNRDEISRRQGKEEILNDYHKLRQYTAPEGLGYSWGAFVLIMLDEIIVEWFEHGKEMQRLTVQPEQTS